MQIIQAVIDHYGVYSAALERAYIRSQQRPAVPLQVFASTGSGRMVTHRVRSLRQTCLRLLRSQPGVYLSAAEIALALQEDVRRVHYTIGDLVQEGYVKKFYVAQRGRGPQRYAARG